MLMYWTKKIFPVLITSFLISNAHAYLSPKEIKNILTKKVKPNPSNYDPTQDGVEIRPLEDIVETSFTNAIDYRRQFYKQGPLTFANAPLSLDRRKFDTIVKKQFGPTCTAFGLAASLENLLENSGTVDVSERHLWSTYRKYSASRAVMSFLKNKVTEEKYWPASEVSPENDDYLLNRHLKLTHATYIDDDINKAITALNRGNPVYIGFKVTKSLGNCDAVVDVDSAPTGGGHAVLISGYQIDSEIDGGGYFIIKNSWGQKCGDQGYQYLPFKHCTRSDLYCIMWEIFGGVSEFPNTTNRVPEEIAFDMNDLTVQKYEWKTTAQIKIFGDYRHLEKIKQLRFINKTTKREKTVKMTTNVVYDFSFDKTTDAVHHIIAKFTLKDGSIHEYPIRMEYKNPLPPEEE